MSRCTKTDGVTQPQPHDPRQMAYRPSSNLPVSRPDARYEAAGYAALQPPQSPVPFRYVGNPYGHATAPRPTRSAGAAVALELVLGILGIFGVGNIYAGRAGLGVALMLSFWALFWINVGLIFLIVGWVTMPLTWIAFLIAGPLLAARAVEAHNTSC